MASAAARSFLEVPVQDVARSPLVAGQVLPGLCVFGLLAVLKNKPHGVDAWNNFDKSAKSKGSDGETTLQGAGVEVSHAKVVGHPKARRVVAPAHVPRFLVITSGRQALPALQSSDLERALVARGLASERVQDLLAEQVQGLQARPEDAALLRQTAAVFGRPLAVRHMRVPKRNGEGTVLVMAAIDLVMAAKGCDYSAAQSIVWNIFKDYYGTDLDAVTYRVRFFNGGRGGGSNSLALDVQGACELLCLIPGSDVGAALRRRAVDTMLRVEGGDTSLLDRIQANRRFQDYLAQHDPDHPLRAIGEHAERRQAEEAVPKAQWREELLIVNDTPLGDFLEESEIRLELPQQMPSSKRIRITADYATLNASTTTVDHPVAFLIFQQPPQQPQQPQHPQQPQQPQHPQQPHAAGSAMFTELVKAGCPGCNGRALKALTLKAYSEFARLVAQDEQRSDASVRAELASSLGAHAAVPEKWQALARAAVEASLASNGPVAAGGPTAPPAAAIPAHRRPAAAPKPFVAEAEHGAAKDAANALWIQQLRPGAVLFFLDSWTEATGLVLRTTRALKRAGFSSQLHSANPDASICVQLRNEGVEAFEGTWEQMPAGSRFDGIYLDLCSGSEDYLRRQLELATLRAAPGCNLAWTLTERNFNGEPLLLRVMGLGEFLQDLGWLPALRRVRASTLLHRSGRGQQVVTQLWQRG